MSESKLGPDEVVRLAEQYVHQGLSWQEAVRRAVHFDPEASGLKAYRHKVETERALERAKKRERDEWLRQQGGLG
jgi:hypothetical protein